MNSVLLSLLALLFSVSGPVMKWNAEIWHSPLAAASVSAAWNEFEAATRGQFATPAQAWTRTGRKASVLTKTARRQPTAPKTQLSLPQRKKPLALLPEKAQSLAAPGARVSIGGVQATEIGGRLTPAQMAALQAEHGTEFAQVYLTGPGRAGGGGTYYLIQGAEGNVQIPIGSNVRLISHTHPEMLQGRLVPLEASGADYNVVRLLQQAGSPQRTSQIVPQVGTPFNFRI